MRIRCWSDRLADRIEAVAEKLRSQRRPKWQTVASSVQGAAHKQKSLPNQDAVLTFAEPRQGRLAIAAVADGHGHATHFRSGTGSAFAVEIAIQLLEKAGGRREEPLDPEEWRLKFPSLLHQRWRRQVAHDLLERPFTQQEFSGIAREVVTDVAMNPAIAYGSTLIGCVVADDLLMAWQLGDGDLLLVDESGQVTRPLAEETVVVGESTFSLCDAEADKRFRSYVKELHTCPPAAVMLSTDGYAKSFPQDQGFLQVGSDMLGLLRQLGPEQFADQLPKWLNSCSEEGSGDDISVGLIFRLDDGDLSHGRVEKDAC